MSIQGIKIYETGDGVGLMLQVPHTLPCQLLIAAAETDRFLSGYTNLQ